MIWLKASPEAIVARIVDAPEADPSKRPLLTEKNCEPAEVARRLLKLREPRYAKYPAVDTTSLTPAEVVAEIRRALSR